MRFGTIVLLTCAIGATSAACRPAPGTPVANPAPAVRTSPDTTEAERVVQAQLEAYNRHDVEAFAATYATDVRGYAYPDRPLFTGIDSLRAQYARFFASAPQVRATVTQRMVQGAHVIDHEEVTGLPDGRTLRAIAIYEVRQGRIASVRFIQ